MVFGLRYRDELYAPCCSENGILLSNIAPTPGFDGVKGVPGKSERPCDGGRPGVDEGGLNNVELSIEPCYIASGLVVDKSDSSEPSERAGKIAQSAVNRLTGAVVPPRC